MWMFFFGLLWTTNIALAAAINGASRLHAVQTKLLDVVDGQIQRQRSATLTCHLKRKKKTNWPLGRGRKTRRHVAMNLHGDTLCLICRRCS